MSETTSLGHTPGERWTFDASVTDCFDDMLRRSIPQYDVMRKAVTDLAGRFAHPGTTIVDLGCSRGDALAPLVARFGAQNYFLGTDVSEPMLDAARTRFAANDSVEIRNSDLRREYPTLTKAASVTIAVLTLQFTPIEYRQRIVRNVYDHTEPGGAFILVEKVLGADAEIDAALVERYYALKGANGYSPEEVERKRLSLEGVLVPVTADWNEELLSRAGFAHVDCFWRWMNFAGWIALK